MPDGTPVDIYTLKDAAIEAKIITYGGIIQSLKVPDKSGNVADVVLGFDTLDEYVNGNKAYFGALIGRYAQPHRRRQIPARWQDLQHATKRRPDKANPVNTLHGGTPGLRQGGLDRQRKFPTESN